MVFKLTMHKMHLTGREGRERKGVAHFVIQIIDPPLYSLVPRDINSIFVSRWAADST